MFEFLCILWFLGFFLTPRKTPYRNGRQGGAKAARSSCSRKPARVRPGNLVEDGGEKSLDAVQESMMFRFRRRFRGRRGLNHGIEMNLPLRGWFHRNVCRPRRLSSGGLRRAIFRAENQRCFYLHMDIVGLRRRQRRSWAGRRRHVCTGTRRCRTCSYLHLRR